MKISNQQLKLLVQDLDLIPVEKLEDAYQEAEREKKPLASVLVGKDLISDSNIGRVIADYMEFEFVDLEQTPIDEEAMAIIPELMAKKQKVIPFGRNQDGVKVAMVNPGNLNIINLIEKKIGQDVLPYYTTEQSLESALTKYQKGIQAEFSQIIKENINEAKAGARAEDLPVVKIVDTIVQYAYENKASDIHIEPTDEGTLIRFRLDGILHDIITLPKDIHDLVVTRIKILSKLRTDEHRSAQDGKFQMKIENERFDLRVSIIPIVEGEKVVIRLLSSKSRQFGLEDLGMSTADMIKLKKEYTKPWGMVVVTGPTGAGKTTTLYSIIKILNRREVNISTVEDPVEYDLDGINQIQVNPKANLTFANGLRSILRQDPDIIMVGEIRDQETADLAISAAMTGHLVLTTLHTNDAPTALPRLLKMGGEPFLLASTINIVMAQRLVRKICKHCIVSETTNPTELKKKFSASLVDQYFGTEEKTIRIYHGKGCSVCGNTGYHGRLGIFEVMPITETLRELIMQRVDADQIRDQAKKEGMKTMIEDGISKVLAGLTTIEEVLRATRE
ncbi:MAG: type II/IV secretion system protein [Candidatus Buchananbacteria bacterium]|nr:type II/IV secretion system protein [Candidatus Buchananbacteria bacterium]